MLGHRVTWSVKEAEAKMVPKISGPQIHTLSRHVLLASISLKQDPLSTHLVSSLSSNPFCFLKSFIILTFRLWHVWLKHNQKNLEPISFSPSSASCGVLFFWKQDILFLCQTQCSYGSKGERALMVEGKRYQSSAEQPSGREQLPPLRHLGGSPQRSQAQGLWGRSCHLELDLHSVSLPVGFPSRISSLLRDKCLWNRALCHQ